MPSKLNRREMLAGAGVLGVAACLPALAWAQAARPAVTNFQNIGDKVFLNQLDIFSPELLRHAPEYTSQLGLDDGALASLRSALSHRPWIALRSCRL